MEVDAAVGLGPGKHVESGKFLFAATREGTVVLTVQAKGYAPDLKVVAAKKDMDGVEFKLEEGRSFKGRVVDPEGKGLAKASLAADTSSRWRRL